MTDTEIQSQREHDERMAKLRSEFQAAWPEMWKTIGPLLDGEPNLHIAAMRASWIVWNKSKATS